MIVSSIVLMMMMLGGVVGVVVLVAGGGDGDSLRILSVAGFRVGYTSQYLPAEPRKIIAGEHLGPLHPDYIPMAP